jgi:hypothetical protein
MLSFHMETLKADNRLIQGPHCVELLVQEDRGALAHRSTPFAFHVEILELLTFTITCFVFSGSPFTSLSFNWDRAYGIGVADC